MKILVEAVDFLLSKIEGTDTEDGDDHYHLSSKDDAKRKFYRQALKDQRFWVLLSNSEGTHVLKTFEFESWNQIDELEALARSFNVKECLVTIGDHFYDVYLGYFTSPSQLPENKKMAPTSKLLKNLFDYF